jgi:hypothetical protein
MTLTMNMSADAIDKFRKSKQIAWPAQRKCAGCKRMRSVTQFNGADDLCLQCRRRHVPDEL